MIQLVNDLNIKQGPSSDLHFPQLLISLVEYQQTQMSISSGNEQKLRELETYLNSLLRNDSAVFSPALRELFQFDCLLRKKEQKRKTDAEETLRFGTTPKHLGGSSLFGARKEPGGNNVVEVDDYFTAGKARDEKSSEESYIIGGDIAKRQRLDEGRRNSIFPESNDGSEDEEQNAFGAQQQRSDSGMLAGIALSKGYFGRDSDED